MRVCVQASTDARFLLGISQLSLSLAGELSDTVGSVHREIHRSTPLGLLPAETNIARHVYALLKKDTGHRWPGQTTHLAALGSPHHGADLLHTTTRANRSPSRTA